MKQCNRCQTEQPPTNFYKGRLYCKECGKKQRNQYRQRSDVKENERKRARAYTQKRGKQLIIKNPLYYARVMWNSMKQRCKNGPYLKRGIQVQLNKDEWMQWAMPEIEKFVTNFPSAVPSVDRIDPDDHYRFGNIRIISRRANSYRSRFFCRLLEISKDDPLPDRLKAAAKAICVVASNSKVPLDELIKFMEKVNAIL